MVAHVADERAGCASRISAPCLSKGWRSASLAAVLVTLTTEVEVGPLSDGSGTGDTAGVGLEEVNLVERGGVLDAGEDDEPEEEERSGHEHEARDANRPV